MPLKFNKEMSTHLFKYVRTINIQFNPFDGRSRSVREFMRQILTKRYTVANPKLVLTVDTHNRLQQPTAELSFIDNTKLHFETKDNNANEMMFQIHLKAMQLDAEYEMEGKSIDEA